MSSFHPGADIIIIRSMMNTATESQKIFFDDKDIRWLFEWKNGMVLSTKKHKSYKVNIQAKLPVLLNLKENFSIDSFRENFKEISAIWQIFLLHILQPRVYPIFDQHVYRTYLVLRQKEIKKMPYTKDAVTQIYFGPYLDFFNGLIKSDSTVDRFELDKALWAYRKMSKVTKPRIIKKIRKVTGISSE